MEAIKAELLNRFSMRRTYAQKTAFIRWAQEYAAKTGIPMRVEESGKWVRSRNLVFGDVDHARTILTAHYDTCAWTPFGAGITPGCWPVLILIELVQLLFLPVLLLMMFFGPTNRHNANDNTSGVLLVLTAMARLQDKPGVAYVLFDNEEKGLFGSAAFVKAHPQAARRFMINADCVGDGHTLLYTGVSSGMRMPQAKRMLAALEEIAPQHGFSVATGDFPKWVYPSDQILFPRGTAVAALKGKKILYMDRIHTGRDTVLDLKNIQCLLTVLEKAAL